MADTGSQDAAAGPESSSLESRIELAEQRSEFAEQRTQWAEHRTLLANERTFSAWLRTGLSSVGGGLAVARFLVSEEFGWVARVVGLLLVGFGGMVLFLAFWRYNRITDILESEEMLPIAPRWAIFTLVGLLMIIVALVLVMIIWQ